MHREAGRRARRGRAGRLALVLLLALLPGVARADPGSQALCAALPGPRPGAEAGPPAAERPSPQVLLRRAAAAYAANRFDEALSALREAYGQTPLPDILFNMAQACRAAGRLADAQRLYERTLEAGPDPSLRRDAERRLAQLRARAEDEQARRTLTEARYGQAIASFAAAYRLDPLPVYLLRQAEAERQAGLIRDALTTYERFLAADPRTPLRAEVEAQLRLLRARAIEASAEGAFQRGRYAEARARFGEVYALAPAPPLLFRMAEAERLLGRRSEAAAGYRRFLSQDQDGGQRLLAEQRLRELLGAPRERRLTGRQLVRRWWFWTAVAVAAAAVVVPVAITQAPLEPSYPDLRTPHFATTGK